MYAACGDMQGDDQFHAGCTLHEAAHVWCDAEWRQQTEDQKKRTEQVILDTSAREAELLLRNRELTQEVICCSKLPDVLFPASFSIPTCAVRFHQTADSQHLLFGTHVKLAALSWKMCLPYISSMH